VSKQARAGRWGWASAHGRPDLQEGPAKGSGNWEETEGYTTCRSRGSGAPLPFLRSDGTGVTRRERGPRPRPGRGVCLGGGAAGAGHGTGNPVGGRGGPVGGSLAQRGRGWAAAPAGPLSEVDTGVPRGV
jgi:hypothetical protein